MEDRMVTTVVRERWLWMAEAWTVGGVGVAAREVGVAVEEVGVAAREVGVVMQERQRSSKTESMTEQPTVAEERAHTTKEHTALEQETRDKQVRKELRSTAETSWRT